MSIHKFGNFSQSYYFLSIVTAAFLGNSGCGGKYSFEQLGHNRVEMKNAMPLSESNTLLPPNTVSPSSLGSVSPTDTNSAQVVAPQASPLSPPRIISSTQDDTGAHEQPYLTMNLPTGVEPNQLLIAVVAIQGTNPLINPWGEVILPSGGWQEIEPLPNSCGGDITMSIAYRIAQPGDTEQTQFTWGFISDNYLTPVKGVGAIMNIAGANTASPIPAYALVTCTTIGSVSGFG